MGRQFLGALTYRNPDIARLQDIPVPQYPVPLGQLPTTTNTTVSGSATGSQYVFGNAAGTSITLTLPDPATIPTGAAPYLWVQRIDNIAADVTIVCGGSGKTIDGKASIKCYQESFMLWCTGSQWFTVGRQKGWINVGKQPIASGVGNFLYSNGVLLDTEMREVEFDYNNVAFSAAAVFLARVRKNGNIESSSYNVSGVTNTGGTAVTGASNPAGTIGVPMSVAGITLQGTLNVANPTSTVAAAQRLSSKGGSSSNGGATYSELTCTADDGYPITGIQFLTNGSGQTTAANSLNVKAFRQ